MEVIGLDSIGMVFLVVVIALGAAYILLIGWKMQFEKGEFLWLILFFILSGMFILAWFRETGDELILGIALFLMIMYLITKWVMGRRRRWTRS